MMNAEKAIAAALEPIIADVVALEKRLDAITLAKGDKGDPGADADNAAIARALADDNEFLQLVAGSDGDDGHDGAGIDAPLYKAGAIYREGALVAAHIGQFYRALRDTAGAPGDCADWARIGTSGFRHRGAFDKDAQYADGDLYVKDFGTFVVVNGAGVAFAHRGMKGERGESVKGDPGAPGKHGRDGTTIVGAQAQGFKLVLVARSADGAIDHIEADFTAAVREAITLVVREQLIELLQGRAA